MLQRANPAGRYAFAALLVANIFLAFGPWLVRLAQDEGVGPVSSSFWRLALAIPLLLLLARWRTKEPLRLGGKLGLILLIGGLFFAADLASWHYGILRTKLGNATLFGNSSTLLFAIYGFIVVRAWPRPAQFGALLLAVIGAALLLGSSYELSRQHLVGDLFAILAGLFYAFYLIAIDRVRQEMAPMPALALSTIAGAGPLLILALVLRENLIPENWTPLILLALGSQVMGQGLLVYSMGYLRPVVVALGLLTQPAGAALVGWAAYDEVLSAADVVGALLICTALVLIRLPQRVATDAREPHLGKDRSAR